MHRIITRTAVSAALVAAITIVACKKDEDKVDCSTKQFTITPQAASGDPCAATNTGSITVTATSSGSTSFSYSLNSGTFQAENSFKNLAPGKYTVAVKDNNGCVSPAQDVMVDTVAAGAKFAAVKALVNSRCGSGSANCHGSTTTRSLATVCDMVTKQGGINGRAVTQANMPPANAGGPLLQADKDKISAWITAGGKYTD